MFLWGEHIHVESSMSKLDYQANIIYKELPDFHFMLTTFSTLERGGGGGTPRCVDHMLIRDGHIESTQQMHVSRNKSM